MTAVAGALLLALLGEPTPVGDEPARALPRAVTVCIDRAGARCWTAAAGDDPCAGGSVFGRAAANDAPGDLLAACWRALK